MTHVTVLGHDGKLLFGLLDASKAPIVLMLGRAQSVQKHQFVKRLKDFDFFCYLESYYEGNSIQEITFPIRLLKLLGVHTIIGPTEHFIFAC